MYGVRQKTAVSIWLLILTFAVLLPGSLQAAEVLPASRSRIPSPRTAAIGGIHAALADDLTSIFSNPAAFSVTEPVLRIAELSVGLSGPVFTISNLVTEALADDVEDVLASEEVTDLMTSLYAGFSLVGPVSFGYVGNGLGFGLFNDGEVIVESASTSVLEFTVRERFLMAGGIGFQIPLPDTIPGRLDTGFLLKGFVTAESFFEEELLDLPDTLGNMSLDRLSDEPFALINGVGLDIGTRYAPSERWAFGITAANLYAPAVRYEYESFNSFSDGAGTTSSTALYSPLELSFGVLYTPRLGAFEYYVNELKLMADYRDALDFLVQPEYAENALLKVSLGAELTILEVLALRAGFARGLPAVGMGLRFPFMELHFAMFGTELSTEPGLRPVYNIMLGFEFRF